MIALGDEGGTQLSKTSYNSTSQRSRLLLVIAMLVSGVLVLLVIGLGFMVGSTSQDIRQRAQGESTTSAFNYPDTVAISGTPIIKQHQAKILQRSFTSELPLLVIKGPQNSNYYLFSTDHSVRCQGSIRFDQTIPFAPDWSRDCAVVSVPEIAWDANENGLLLKSNEEVQRSPKSWAFTYNGVMGAGVVGYGSDRMVVGVQHNEHQNVSGDGGKLYQGSIYPNVKAENCAAGFKNTANGWEYAHCWESFAGFVSLTYANFDSVTSSWVTQGLSANVGPILWPSSGYISSTGQRKAGGPYGPSLFVDKEYMYVFYSNDYDRRPTSTDACITVARAPISNYGPQGWMNYYNGSFSSPTLPQGFQKENYADFLSVGGGPADCISLPGSHEPGDAPLFLSVAKDLDTNRYIGVEEVIDGGRWKLQLRSSIDLIHWSLPTTLQTGSGGWGTGDFSNPHILKREQDSMHEVRSSKGFFILGKRMTDTAVGGQFFSMELPKVTYSPGAQVIHDAATASQLQGYFQSIYGWRIDTQHGAFQRAYESSKVSCRQLVDTTVKNNYFYWSITANPALSAAQWITKSHQALYSSSPDAATVQRWTSWVQNNPAKDRYSLLQEIASEADTKNLCVFSSPNSGITTSPTPDPSLQPQTGVQCNQKCVESIDCAGYPSIICSVSVTPEYVFKKSCRLARNVKSDSCQER